MMTCPRCGFLSAANRVVWNSSQRRREYHYRCVCGGSYITTEILVHGEWPVSQEKRKEPPPNV